MKETKIYLKERWQSDFKLIGENIPKALKSRNGFHKSDWPRTKEGFVDLRGYSAPKKYTQVKSNSGQYKQYVSESIQIKNNSFQKVDFSLSDFECAEFFNCHFENCKFDQSRFVNTKYWGCTFKNICFHKTYLEWSSFITAGIIFRKIIDNFKNVSFENVNLTETGFLDQRFFNCIIRDCNTGALSFSGCELHNFKFTGIVKNVFFINSKKIESVDMQNSILIGLQIKDQEIDGFKLPDGDSYYFFSNRIEELENLKLPQNLSNHEVKTIEDLKSVWLNKSFKSKFVDINWIDENEIETGKLLIKLLKKANR